MGEQTDLDAETDFELCRSNGPTWVENAAGALGQEMVNLVRVLPSSNTRHPVHVR